LPHQRRLLFRAHGRGANKIYSTNWFHAIGETYQTHDLKTQQAYSIFMTEKEA
jgi:hypothetical protein